MIIIILLALIPAGFGGWFLGAWLAQGLQLNKREELLVEIIIGIILWLGLAFT